MKILSIKDINLEKVLLGGQSFTWERTPKGEYIGVTQEKAIKLSVRDEIYWQTYPVPDDDLFVNQYFRVDWMIDDLISEIRKDDRFSMIPDEYWGIRLLSQPPELTILSFLLSSNKNIQAIKKSVGILRERYGEKVLINGSKVPLFPRTDLLATLMIDEFAGTGIGYRAKYLVETSKKLHDDRLINDLQGNKEELREYLLGLPGIGPKVADCVMTFSFGCNDISPVDIWVKRILVDHFGLEDNWTYKRYSDWISENFGEYSSWLFQILFEWYREK